MNDKNGTDTQNGLDEEVSDQKCCCSAMTTSGCQDLDGIGLVGMRAEMYQRCHRMNIFKWFPLVPVVLGTIAFLLGYLLPPEFLRMLWLIASGVVVVMGLLGFIVIGKACRKADHEQCG